jgi:hypothetical protein
MQSDLITLTLFFFNAVPEKTERNADVHGCFPCLSVLFLNDFYSAARFL